MNQSSGIVEDMERMFGRYAPRYNGDLAVLSLLAEQQSEEGFPGSFMEWSHF